MAHLPRPVVRATVVQASTVFYDTPATLGMPLFYSTISRTASGFSFLVSYLAKGFKSAE